MARSRSRTFAAVAAAAALLLATGAQAQAQQQQLEPMPMSAVISSPGRRDEVTLAAVRQRLEEPLPARRGCATPEPTNDQIGAAAEAIMALRARREAAGEAPTAAGLRQSLLAQPPTVVPTYFHVVYPVKQADVEKTFPNGTYGGDDYIARQIEVLNAGYNGTGFQFSLAGVTRTANPSWANAGYGTPEADAMFRKLRQGAYDALNFFVVYPGGGLLGYATFPLAKSSTASMRRLDGVVLHYQTLPSRPGEKAPWAYSEGQTAVHEAGHWFGLLHTFQGGCEEEYGGDQVADTPAEANPTFGCAVQTAGSNAKPVDTCPDSKGVDSIHNFMSYSDDECLEYFTPGQIERMVASFDGLRRGIKVQSSSSGGNGGRPRPNRG